MATIPVPGGLIRHVRKTIAFDGGAGSGQKDSPITVFGLTGEVLLIGGASGVLLRCTETFVGAALANTVLADADGEWATDDMAASAGEVFNPSEFNWIATNIVPVVAFGGSGNAVLLSDYTLTPVDGAGAAAAITDGTLRVHAWYIPLTDDGALAGDDIDIEMDDYIAAAVWAATTRVLTALDEDTTTLDIDAAVRGAVGMASANLDTQLAAIPTLAELQAEIASGDDAVLSAIAGLNDLDGTAIATAVWANATRTLSALGFTLQASDLAADTIGASELAADAITEIVTGVWTTALTEAYNADGAAPTGAQALFVIMQRLVDFAISGTTITVKKIDGTTTAYTLTLDDANSPTSSGRAT